MVRKLLMLALFACFNLNAGAQAPYVTTQPYINSGLVKPVEITNCKDSRLFIVEQDGRIRIVMNDTLMSTPFLDINPQVISIGTEQGLLGLAFDPDYKINGFFYVNYTNNQGHTIISRFSVDPADSNRALTGSEVVLKQINQPYTNHNGGDIEFGNDGCLFVPLGDGGSAYDPQNRGQNKKELLGKILRLNVSYGNKYVLPPDNPHLNDTAWAPEIWSLGVRNPWKATVDRYTGDFWFGDVGQDVWEEVDYVKGSAATGANFGWRCYEATHPHITSGCQPQSFYTDPVYEYQHVGGNCSVTGGVVYRGAEYGNLFGHYLFADFCIPNIRSILKENDSTFTYFSHSTWSGAGISIFGEDMLGNVYVGNLYNGQIRRIVDTTSCAPAAFISDRDTVVLCTSSGTLSTPAGDSLIYTWYLNGTLLPAATAAISINQDGLYVVNVQSLKTGCSASDSAYVLLTPVPPVVGFTGLSASYCENDPPVTLSGSPAGGVFSGLGISGSQFNPASTGITTALVRYEYLATNGCRYSADVATEVNQCQGIMESGIISKLTAMPNPADEFINISFNSLLEGTSRCLMMDATGRVLKSEILFHGTGTVQHTWNLNDIAAGIYVLSVQNENGWANLKLMLR